MCKKIEIHITVKMYRRAEELNRDRSVVFKPENVLKWYKSESGFYFIHYPHVKSYDVVHTVASGNRIKHHFKKNFMTLTYNFHFIRLVKNLYVGLSSNFMGIYFCELNKLKLEDMTPNMKKAVEEYEARFGK